VVATTSIGTNLLSASTISGITLGGTLGALTNDATLNGSSFTGAGAVSDWGLNLANSNTWTGAQLFSYTATSTYSGGIESPQIISKNFIATSTTVASTFPYASTTALTVSGTSYLGTVASGLWNGTAIGNVYGGTNQNSSAWTGVPSVSSGTWSINTTLPVSLGGTPVHAEEF